MRVSGVGKSLIGHILMAPPPNILVTMVSNPNVGLLNAHVQYSENHVFGLKKIPPPTHKTTQRFVIRYHPSTVPILL